MKKHKHISGFTLIEMSIVLLIIGLIVGGVLVGQDLIAAASIRSQISQIERYNTATHTFQVKYGFLPGDIPDPQASQFGFAARGQYAGEGDGNGIIQGVGTNASGSNQGAYQLRGETVMFWVDLSAAGLIDGNFNSASSYNAPTIQTNDALYPAAKIGSGNYLFVNSIVSGLGLAWWCNGWCSPGANYFSVAVLNGWGSGGSLTTSVGLSVSQAYNIDKKVDDGMPKSGNIEAIIPSGTSSVWSTNAPTASSTTCFDTTTNNYSTTQNNGSGINCALSFKFQ